MILFPAIDLYEGKAVRLYKGDYNKMTVYSDNPISVALEFVKSGCSHVHIVDLEGAKSGTTPNFETVKRIKKESGAFCEIGGGIRSIEVIEKYVGAGLDRIILGTAAVKDRALLEKAVKKYGDKIAVGMDVRDGKVSVSGWQEDSGVGQMEFAGYLNGIGVKYVICTDISRDGAMRGVNRELYRTLSDEFSLKITASGGVSSIDDLKALRDMNLYAAIIGKAYYTGAIDLKKAVELES